MAKLFKKIRKHYISAQRCNNAKQEGFLIMRSPNDLKWYVYSDYLDMYLYESFDTFEEATNCTIDYDSAWRKEDI